MKEFIDFLLRFGSLNQQQIDLITEKGFEKTFRKEDYFAEAGKELRQVGFIIEGILRVCCYTNKGDEITKIFIEENHLIFKPDGFPMSEYIQAATDCRMVLFTNKDWEEITRTIVGFDLMLQKIITKALAEKLARVSPLVSQDATTRYTEFLEKYPTLANRIPLAYIASYLGITQTSLSRIRRNIR
ncbi:Crp/Fnr family transcriptional regulator [Pseudoflavitalea sp. G-6-1-2]|uniref:Crp/Fnr family transcriptional regulator n=1 Tax=Pseudoflavitalea sp. G-6-1-2 TaxID=2728841 RepID=UPI00146AE104|nr:Crp/Fnr family transcriptional regulator [Pseudoflavitalea sp. G-6-1-2]NML22500.1 Crp/Fnr family transcriptional regulator [Pseudoflavitalea sp. G-6-1-2]